MPELPEVETVARQLSPLLLKKTVEKIQIVDPKLKSNSFRKLHGAKIKNVFRNGKTVVLEMQQGKESNFLSVHLRMTGRLVWKSSKSNRTLGKYYLSANDSDAKHVRAIFHVKGGELGFVDTRRFGTITIDKDRDDLNRWGLDPTTDELSYQVLSEMLSGCKQEIKVWLMRQDKLCGIGNIYASEILFDSRIHPKRLAADLDESEVKAIFKSTKKILKKAIENCGTTFSDFQDTTGSTGSYQRFLKVYGRDGENCKKCQSEIERIVQAQRSTFFCATCQS